MILRFPQIAAKPFASFRAAEKEGFEPSMADFRLAITPIRQNADQGAA